jgi:hypothetical protein
MIRCSFSLSGIACKVSSNTAPKLSATDKRRRTQAAKPLVKLDRNRSLLFSTLLLSAIGCALSVEQTRMPGRVRRATSISKGRLLEIVHRIAQELFTAPGHEKFA